MLGRILEAIIMKVIGNAVNFPQQKLEIVPISRPNRDQQKIIFCLR